MKSLIFRLVLPLTIISFSTVTKWWHALVVDAPDRMFTGFPFPFVCDGFHTSLSLQIFIAEFIADFLIYLMFWLVVVFIAKRLIKNINPPEIITTALWFLTGLFVFLPLHLAINPDNMFELYRPFDIEVIKTGYKFTWEYIERPEYNRIGFYD